MVRISMCNAAKPCSIYRMRLMIYQRSLLITKTNNLPPFLDRHDSMPSWILEAFCHLQFRCFYFFKSGTWVFLSFMTSESLCPEKLELVEGWSVGCWSRAAEALRAHPAHALFGIHLYSKRLGHLYWGICALSAWGLFLRAAEVLLWSGG